MTKITFYLIRHGESEGNEKGLFRGRRDFPLTDFGKEQAKSLAKELHNIRFSAIISSPLKRAYETALFIAEGRKVRVMEEFNNIYLASWEGESKEEIKRKYPKEWNLWVTEPERLKIEGAETIDEVQLRAKEGILKLKEEYKEGGNLCIVTHRAVLKPLFAGLLGIEKPYFWKLHFDTASYSIIEYNERGFVLKKLNVTHHLPFVKVELV